MQPLQIPEIEPLQIRELIISPKVVKWYLQEEARQLNGPFWEVPVIARVTQLCTRALRNWTAEDEKIIVAFIDECFFEMVAHGSFEKTLSGNYKFILTLLKEARSHVSLPLYERTFTPAPRVNIVVSRIVRDTPAATALKNLYEGCCQVCGITLRIGEQNYSEAHHLRPLGTPHNGPDEWSNMMVLCPNHHALFDYGVPAWQEGNTVEIEGVTHLLEMRHDLEPAHVEYYKQHLKISDRAT